MKLPNNLRQLRQKNIKWLGALADTLLTLLPLLSVISFLSVLVVLYAQTYPYIHEYLPWFRFWHFVVILAMTTIAGMALVYVYVVPSLWTFRENQMSQHDNETLKLLRSIESRLKALEERTK